MTPLFTDTARYTPFIFLFFVSQIIRWIVYPYLKNWTNCLLIWCDQTFRLLYQVPEFWSTLEHWNSGTALHSGASQESFSWGAVCLSSWLIPVHSTRFFLALFIPPYKRKAIFCLTVETLTGVMVGTFSLLQVIVPLSLSQ